MNRRWSCFVIVAVLTTNGPMQQAFAQFDEDDLLAPGVITEFDRNGQRVRQVDVDISADWGTASPHSRLRPGMFAAEWTAELLIQQTGEHQFHVFVHGRVSIEIDGKTVLEGKADEPQWISGNKFTPGVGLRPLKVRFQKTAAAARIQLCWSSETFPLEPVPPHLLFREGGRQDLARIERGRRLFVAHRCARCHSDAESNSRGLPAPDLNRSVAGISTHWLMNKLMGDESVRGRMPHFGLDRELAAAIALTLLDAAKTQPRINDKLPKPAKGRDDSKDTASGHTLIKSLGCLACHAVKGLGASGPFAGPDLSAIGEKRTLSWLFRWLKDPASLNTNHNMPVFDLSNQERRQLALALDSLQLEIVSPLALGATTPDVLAQGKQLMADLRCVSCHSDPRKLDEIPKRAGDLGEPVADWNVSCLADEPDFAKSRPAFPGTDREALRAYLESTDKPASHVSAIARGREMFEVQNCAACHPRGRSRGVIGGLAAKIASSDVDLNGLSTRLVPPSLSGIGDRFRDEALAAAILGKQPRRLPWLHVRMPRFNPERVDAKTLVAHFIGHDRIADDAPTWKPTPPDQKVSDEELIYGQELVGVKGFSCIACHKVGDYEPQNTAMGTRGSDLLGLRKRMRRQHFIRWTRSPLRIVPGLEMPSYTRPAVGSHAKSVDGQLETLWRTLNDSRFESPTNPASVEQFLVVESGQKTRIVRDVFTNPEENGGGYVARSFAMGFPNGHSVLLDLDTLTLRRWTFGDFARQRTVGKSWYWDMAGTDFVTRMPTGSDYALVKQGLTGKAAVDAAIRPIRSNATVGQLLSYAPLHDQAVNLRYRMMFEVEGESLHLDIAEFWQGYIDPFGTVNGVSRTIEVKSIPPGYDLLHFVPVTVDNSTFGEPLVGVQDGGHEFMYVSPQERKQGKPVGVKLVAENGHANATVNYSTSIRRPSLETRTKPVEAPPAHVVNSMPGFDGIQLPLSQSIMPTAMTVLDDGRLAFTSLKGDVYIAHDSDDDGVEDTMTLFEEGLAAPYGIIQDGDSIIVAHKPELLRLRDTDGDGRADERTVFATGWGYNDNYHDWACGIVRNSKGELFIGLGSDYAQSTRPLEYSRWRGKVLRIEPNGTVHPFSHAFRYPTGLAIDAQDRLFGTDNQGVQNTFNEINHLRDGVHYGVPKHHEESLKVDASGPALHVPHPWTRSVNGLQILPDSFPASEIAGHGVGAEYNGKLLVRFSYHEVAGQLQGAIYYLSQPNFKDADANFQGPICVTAGPDGELYVGSIHDSGWLGGLNTGSIVKLTARKDRPNGIREIRATSDGFEIRFIRPVDRNTAAKTENYSISGYTRVWKGGYGTPDSGRYVPEIASAKVSPAGDAVHLSISPLKTGFVYDITTNLKDGNLWPSTGHYTLNRVP